ncbi:type I restriction endonuclease [Muribaculaceae bacterium Isolate-105 (HZI)]|nr:type I restriction endonuclease [Muribaculaceae bacterium Isolate-105 (HZI)]
MDTQKLRQRILDLAIRGKLVPQDPNDEPASVLLERIRAEKERLIAEGKIKRPKAKKSTDKSHYQQFTPPFDIPDSWEWVRLEDIARIGTGATPSKSNRKYYGGNINWVSSSATSSLYVDVPTDFITELALKETNCEIYPIGTLLMAMYGEGKTRGQVTELRIEAASNQACAAIIPHIAATKNFVKLYLLANYYQLRRLAEGGNQPNLNLGKISSLYIPIPPVQEQQRILEQYRYIIESIELIEKSKALLGERIYTVKSKILDLAMQGKLVPQDPADEPAADMLRRINPKAKIITDNPHYTQLPDNWTLTRIKDVFEVNPKNKASNNIQAGFVPMASIHDGYSNKFHYDVKQWGEIKSGFTHFADGDIAVAKISPCLENRKSMILRELPNGIGAGTTELLIFRSTILIPEFSLLFFKSNNFIKCCTGTFNGVVGQQRVGKSIVEDIHIPIPPLNIQRTIVQGVQEWFNCLDNILVSISNERDSLI